MYMNIVTFMVGLSIYSSQPLLLTSDFYYISILFFFLNGKSQKRRKYYISILSYTVLDFLNCAVDICCE